MLTSEKIDIYKSYKGDYDGYYIQNRNQSRIISANEWDLLASLIQDILLIRKGLASKSFEDNARKDLSKNCDNKKTIELIFELEKYLNV